MNIIIRCLYPRLLDQNSRESLRRTSEFSGVDDSPSDPPACTLSDPENCPETQDR